MIINKREKENEYVRVCVRKEGRKRERDALPFEEQCRDPYSMIMQSATGYNTRADDRYDSGS